MTFTGGFEILSKPKRFYSCYNIRIKRSHQVTVTHTHTHTHTHTLSHTHTYIYFRLCRVELMLVSMVYLVKLPAVLFGHCLVIFSLLGPSSFTAFKSRLGWRTYS